MNLLKALYLMKKTELPIEGDHRSPSEGIFIVGCGRSGTTLLRRLLESHSELGSGPETSLFTKLDRWEVRWTGKAIRVRDWDWIHRIANQLKVWPGRITSLRESSSCLAEFADQFFERFFLSNKEEQRWVEKTPGHVHAISYLSKYFPKAKFIQILRHPLDVLASLKNHPQWTLRHGKRVPLDTDNTIEECLDRWERDIKAGLKGKEELPLERYHELQYEDLIRSPQRVLESVQQFLGLSSQNLLKKFSQTTKSPETIPNNPRANQKLDESRIGRWKQTLSSAEVEKVNMRIQSLSEQIGYRLQETSRD